VTRRVKGSKPRSGEVARRIAALSLLGLFGLQVLLTSRNTSPAFDEVAILPAGYLFLKTGTWRLIPEHPPLIPALCALPLLLLDPRLDLPDSSSTEGAIHAFRFGSRFIFKNNADQLLFWGRLPLLALSLLLGYVVYRWARELYGGNAGLMALTLYAFCPSLIAHAGFTSHDIGVACFFTLSLYSLWRLLADGRWPRLLLTGILLGCALASKTTAVILLPAFATLLMLAAWHPSARHLVPSGRHPLLPATRALQQRLRWSLVALGLMVLIAFALLYAVYLFPKDPLFYVKAIVRAPRLHASNSSYYLMGEFRTEGWWYYFLVAYALKTPLPMLLLIPLAIWHWRRQNDGWFDEVFLLLPAITLLALISAMADALGVRYILAIYPLLFIFVSRTVTLFSASRGWAVVGIILAIWYLSTPIRIYPDYLAHFNELVGGPKHGIEYLDDSNIDWGQNLKRLKHYLDGREFGRVKLLYVGTGWPRYYRIHAEPFPLTAMGRRPEPGIYIISAQALVWARADFGMDWLKEYELLDVIGYSFYVFRIR